MGETEEFKRVCIYIYIYTCIHMEYAMTHMQSGELNMGSTMVGYLTEETNE